MDIKERNYMFINHYHELELNFFYLKGSNDSFSFPCDLN